VAGSVVLSSARRPGRTWSTGHPLGRVAAACWIGRLCAGRHRPPRAEEGLSSSQDSLLTVQHPLRRRVLGHPLQVPGCFPWPSPQPEGLGSLLVRLSAGLRDDACSGFAAAADRPVARPLSGALSLRFDGGIPPDAGSRATGDPGVSPDRTLTGWLP